MWVGLSWNFNNRSEHMFKGINKLITSITGIEDDYEEDYDDEIMQESVEKTRVKSNRKNEYEEEDEEEDSTPSFFERKKRTAKDEQKVIPIRNSVKSGTEVYVMMPKSFEEVQDICDRLITGAIVVLNLEAIDPAEAQRISDFAFGTFRVVSRYVYIISPENIELSAENEEELIDTLFTVPKLNVQ